MINELKILDIVSFYKQGRNDIAHSLYLLNNDIINNDYRNLKLLCESLKNNEDRVTFLKELFFFDEIDQEKPLIGNVKKQELLDILLKQESLSDLFEKIVPSYRIKVILDIIENTDDSFYQKNKDLLLKDKLPLLLISKDNIRIDYMEKLFEDYSQDLWIANMFSYIGGIDQQYHKNIYSNITKTLEYCYKKPVNFFNTVKNYYEDNEYYIRKLLFISVKDEDLIKEKRNYTHYLLGKLNKENISLETILIQSSVIVNLSNIDPVIFKELLDFSVKNNNIKFIDDMILNYNQEKDLFPEKKEFMSDNLDILYSTKVNFEKNKISEVLIQTDKKLIKQRL